MSENKKDNIGRVALKLMHTVANDIDAGCYDYLLSLDMNSIIESFNNGDSSVLYSEEIEKFLNIDISAIKVLNSIIAAKTLLKLKDYFYNEVEKLQDGMIYNPKDVYYCDRYTYGRGTLTYFQTDLAFSLAERIVTFNRSYALLKFLLKYENIKEAIKTRRRLIETINSNPDETEKLRQVISQYDDNVGIVKITEDDQVTVKVGTKHDMEISNLIGRPYPADCDLRGYDYGSHGSLYHEPHKVTKDFYENGTTSNHKKLIEEEKKYRIRLSKSTIDEKGFIISGDKAVIISSLELTKLGIDPKSVGWQPIRLSVTPLSLFKVCKQYESTRYLSLGTKLQLKKNIILSKKQH